MSCQSGLFSSISLIFYARGHFLIAFSRAIASTIQSYIEPDQALHAIPSDEFRSDSSFMLLDPAGEIGRHARSHGGTCLKLSASRPSVEDCMGSGFSQVPEWIPDTPRFATLAREVGNDGLH